MGAKGVGDFSGPGSSPEGFTALSHTLYASPLCASCALGHKLPPPPSPPATACCRRSHKQPFCTAWGALTQLPTVL